MIQDFIYFIGKNIILNGVTKHFMILSAICVAIIHEHVHLYNGVSNQNVANQCGLSSLDLSFIDTFSL